MKRLLQIYGGILLSLWTAGGLHAGDQTFNFDSDPSLIPGFLIITEGHAAWNPSDGNPSTGGFLDIADAANSEYGLILFPIVDLFTNTDNTVDVEPIKAFKLDADVRIGNGTATPADGFSISFARLNDPVIYNATNTGVLRGTAGGDSLNQASEPASNIPGCDAGNAESGTKTGVAISFDAWQGNWLPWNGVATNYNTAGTPSNDQIGLDVRVDDVTLLMQSMPDLNGACADTNSLQTGPRDGTGSTTPLCWAHLTVELTTNKTLNVAFKNTVLLTNYSLPTISLPIYGRLVMMGRTGGANENEHVDNIHVVTTPSSEASLLDVIGSYNSFTFHLKDLGVSIVTNISQVLLDGVDVTSGVTWSKNGGITTAIYTSPTMFTPRSSHNVAVTFQTSVPQTLGGSGSFTVPPWKALPSALALAQSSVSTPGFVVNAVQTKAYNPNTLRWSEEQLLGLHGADMSDHSTATLPGGMFAYNGVINFCDAATIASTAGGAGEFTPNGPTTNNEVPWTTFGLFNANYFANEDNSVVEMFAYIYFPTSGIYNMYVGSDDGFRLTYAQNASDRMGTEIYSFNGARGISAPGDLMGIKVDASGAYPMRMLWENGGGGADLEWYFEFGNTFVLLGDPNCPVKAYQNASDAGPYVKSATPGVDGQDVIYYKPIIIDLADGTGTRTIRDNTVALTVDGAPLALTPNRSGSVLHLVQATTPNWAPGGHTNVLTFLDNSGVNHSYSWNFSSFNLSNYTVVSIPLSNMVATTTIDHTKPGFLIRSYQTATVGNPNNMDWTEEQLIGVHGTNSASYWGTNVVTEWNGTLWGQGLIDFSGPFVDDNHNYTSPAQWAYNNGLDQVGIATPPDNSSMDIAAWLEFPAAGTFAMVFNSDDSWKCESPWSNPLNRAGAFRIGRIDAGRGSSGPPGDGGAGPRGGLDYVLVNIPAAGAYPFRLLWENGGGGAGVEWTIYQVLPNGNVAEVLINDTNVTGCIKAYATQLSTPPSIVSAYPVQDSTVFPYLTLTIVLQDGTTAVVGSSITISVNGVAYTPAVNQSGGLTTITVPPPPGFWAKGSNHVVLTFSDGTTTRTYAWNFNAEYQTLPVALATAPGSGSNPGFRMAAYQTANNNFSPNGWQNMITMANEAMNGLLGPNAANLTSFTHGGYFWNSTVINYAQDSSGNLSANGDFSTNSTPPVADMTFPGLPGIAGVMDNDAIEVNAFLEFPTAGFYIMGVNSDDGFRVSVGDRTTGKSILKVLAPSPLAGEYAAIQTAMPNYGFGKWPPSPSTIIAQAVIADPLLAGSALNNAAAINGKIAIVKRGTYGFIVKCKNAQNAGAIAVIVVNSDANAGLPNPSIMGGTDNTITIPCLFVNNTDGNRLIAAGTTTTASPLVLMIGDDASMNLGEFDGGRGSSDTIFGIKVPQAGLYPLRLLWYNGGGDANCEWFVQDINTGVNTLINDPSSPVKAWISRTPAAAATMNRPVVLGNAVSVSWTGAGELETALSPTGPWIKSVIQDNPATFPLIPGVPSTYFRVRTY